MTLDREPPLEEGSHSILWRWGLLFTILLGCLLRILASLDEFWQDEIWTWYIVVHDARNTSDIFFKIKHENNHFLNSLAVWTIWNLTEGEADGTLYRIPAVAAGILALLSILRINADRGTATFFSLILFATSYLQVHYGSEARGYSYSVLFGLLSFWALESEIKKAPRLVSPVPWLLILGILSQPVFVTTWIPLALWSMWTRWSQKPTPARWVVQGLLWHGPPAAVLGLLWFNNLKDAVKPGGPIEPLSKILGQTGSLALGGPYSGEMLPVAGGLFLLLLVGTTLLLRAQRQQDWWLYPLSVLLIPVTVILILQRQEVYPRYFLVGLALGLIGIGRGLAILWERGLLHKIIVACALGLITLGNLNHVTRLIDRGRGGYIETLTFMQKNTKNEVGYFEVDHKTRHFLVLLYTQAFIEAKPALVPASENRPEWFLAHTLELDEVPKATMIGPNGDEYLLVHQYHYAGLSGWNLFLYRRAE